MKNQVKPTRKNLKSTHATGKELPPREKKGHFPIVGIDASVGGLEALELSLAKLPADSGRSGCIYPKVYVPSEPGVHHSGLARSAKS